MQEQKQETGERKTKNFPYTNT